MQWDELDDERDGSRQLTRFGVSVLALPVRVEVSLSGTPWEFRARLSEAGVDYCLLTLVSPCAPALRRGATALLHVGTLGTLGALGAHDVSFVATIVDVFPRASGLTLRCAIDRAQSHDEMARLLETMPTRRSA